MFVALGIRAILSFVAYTAAQYFSTLSHNGTIFEGGGGERELLNIKYVFRISLQILSATFLKSKKNWARYGKKMNTGLHVT